MFKVQQMYSKMFVTVNTYKEALNMAREAARVHTKDSYTITEEKGGRWYKRGIVGNKYELLPRSNGYEIKKANGKSRLSLIKVYNGEYAWGMDASIAKVYKTFRAAQDALVLIESRRA